MLYDHLRAAGIVLAILLLILAKVSCDTAKPSLNNSVQDAALDTPDVLPNLVQNQVPENPFVTRPAPPTEPLLKTDSFDKFREVPEEESIKNTPYGKPQL